MRLLVLLALVVGCKKDGAGIVGPSPVEAPIPTDPKVRIGKLDNGLTYFIEVNKRPENRAVLRLAVDAGSLLEEDDQLGIAHFLEHMAFNGTEEFPHNKLVTYLESVGTKFGPHLNAHTSFDETVYKLTVPTDDAEVFDKGLTVLEQWACCMTLDGEEIDKERGVVLEEWRLREGLQQRLTDVRIPLIFWGSKYVDRLPIGTDDSLKNFDPDVVRRFYKDWYRPDLMAVIVVGDVDPDAIEAKIKERFGGLKNPQPERAREEFSIPPQQEPLYGVRADPELPISLVSITAKMDSPQMQTRTDWKKDLELGLGTAVFNERIAELIQDPNSPMLQGGGSSTRLTPTEGAHIVQVVAKEGRLLEAYQLLQTELRRFREFGVTPPELDRAKAARIESMNKYEREADTTDSVVAADEIVRHFLQQEAMPGTVAEAKLVRALATEITAEEVNRAARTFLVSDSLVTLVFLPEKEGLEVPTVEQLKTIDAQVDALTLEAPEEVHTIDSLGEVPQAGEVASHDEQYAEKLGFQGWTLTNGVKIYAKKTDFKAGAIQFQAIRDGGTGAVDDAEFINAWAAGRIRSASGLNGHDRSEIARFLKGKTLGVSANLGSDRTTINGSSSVADLDTMLQLLNLNFTHPDFTKEGTERALSVWKEQVRNQSVDPDQQFSQRWKTMFWEGDPRREPLTEAKISTVERERAEVIWHEALGSPEEWTFVFVGDLPDDFEAKITTWLGSLKKTEKGLPYKDRGYNRIPGERADVLTVGSAERARYRTEWWTTLDASDYTLKNRIHHQYVADILSVLLREKLREELGGVYGVRVSTSMWDRAYYGEKLRVEFQCDPERVDELVAAMEAVIEEVRKHGIEAPYVEAQIAKAREGYEDAVKTNGFWTSVMRRALEDSEDPLQLLEIPEIRDAFTAAEAQQIAEKIFAAGNRGTLTLLPKESPSSE